jgi:hypothetical protein
MASASSQSNNAFHADGSRALAPEMLKPLGPQAIRAEIFRLRDVGLYAIPVHLFWNPGSKGKEGKEPKEAKKDACFPKKNRQIKDPASWHNSIDRILRQVPDANGLAILSGPSRPYCIDVDVASTDKKRSGMELWNRLVELHGQSETLTERTGSGGIHMYFKANSPGLECTKNFSVVKVDGEPFAVDGRGQGGDVFAARSSYINGKGELAAYQWLNGPPSYDACKDMPSWLSKFLNDQKGRTPASVAVTLIETCEPPPEASIAEDEIYDEASPPTEVQRPPPDNALLLAELSKMLKEEAGDFTSTFASVLPHGLYGTYYCYRTHGPRRCFLGHMHNGRNNFNLEKRERNVYYRCHGEHCSHKPAKKLGVLQNLKAALQDATTAPVDPDDDMHVVTQYTNGSKEAQDLLLHIIVENVKMANGAKAYASLGRLFAYMYMIEGRILVTVNSVESKHDPMYFYWSGSSWAMDSHNLVSSVFTSQMGHLLGWYERQRERHLGSLYERHPDLQGFVVDGSLKPLIPTW